MAGKLKNKGSYMKWPFAKRSKYEEALHDIDIALEQKVKMEAVIKVIYSIVIDWQTKKVGNLRAISEIAKIFKAGSPKWINPTQLQ